MLSLASLCVACVLQSGDPATPPGGFAITEQTDVTVQFSDNASTTADVRFPSTPPGASGWPVIVFIHGLFGSKASVAAMAQDFARWGYCTIDYDVRGHATSTGVHTYFGLRERLDLAEILYWALGQYGSLCDPARLGVAGGSQGAIFSWDSAAWSGAPFETNPWIAGNYPAIGAIVVDNLTADFADTFAPQSHAVHCTGAAALLSNIGVNFDTQLQAQAQTAFETEDYGAWRAIVADPLRDPSSHVASITVPTMVMTAWDDYWFPAASIVQTWKHLPASTPHKLYLGTGGHSTPVNNPELAFRNDWRRAWFDHFFKGVSNGIDSGPKITYAVTPNQTADYMALNSQWEHKTARTWPPEGTYDYQLFMHDNMHVSPFAPRGTEAREQLAQSVTPGYSATDIVNAQFRLAQIEPFIAHPTLDYTGSPLASAIPYAGDARVHLSVACATSRYQVTASIWDVAPDGSTRYVTSGSHFVFDDVAPGANEFDIDMSSNAYVFEVDHRIRIELDTLAVHQPPTGASLRFAPYPCDFQVEVRHEAGLLSYLELPVPDSVPIVFGVAQQNSAGCTPAIGIEGAPSLSSTDPCTISASSVLADKPGLLLYGLGMNRVFKHGGWLYVAQPIRRGTLLHPAAVGVDPACPGQLEFDFNAWMQSGIDPTLLPGARVYAQFWMRDPGAPSTTNLSNAVEFTIQD
jgi:predicted acyl esterase